MSLVQLWPDPESVALRDREGRTGVFDFRVQPLWKNRYKFKIIKVLFSNIFLLVFQACFVFEHRNLSNFSTG